MCSGCENEFMAYALHSGALDEMAAVGGMADWLFQSNVLPQFPKETEGKIDAFSLGAHAGEALDFIVSHLEPLIRETLGPVRLD